MKAWSDFGLKGKIALVGVGTLTDENILKGMGDEALGVITSLLYSSALDNPGNKKFSAAYEKRYNRTTSLSELTSACTAIARPLSFSIARTTSSACSRRSR